MRFFLYFFVIPFSIVGCVNVGETYKAEHQFVGSNKVDDYSYLISTTAFRSEANFSNGDKNLSIDISTRNISDNNLIGEIIEGAAMKCGLSIISANDITSLGKAAEIKALQPKWAISGRTSRALGYSQEVSVSLMRYSDKITIYRGLGEYMGTLDSDDIRGATIAAMAGLCSATQSPIKSPVLKGKNNSDL